MLLGDVLAGLSNETEVVNSQVRLDHADKLVVYMEPGILRNSTVATEVSDYNRECSDTKAHRSVDFEIWVAGLVNFVFVN